jgi:hypothetical protein
VRRLLRRRLSINFELWRSLSPISVHQWFPEVVPGWPQSPPTVVETLKRPEPLPAAKSLRDCLLTNHGWPEPPGKMSLAKITTALGGTRKRTHFLRVMVGVWAFSSVSRNSRFRFGTGSTFTTTVGACSHDRAERSVCLRLRQEVQAVLRRGEGDCTSTRSRTRARFGYYVSSSTWAIPSSLLSCWRYSREAD